MKKAWPQLPFEEAVASRGSGTQGLPQKEWKEEGAYPVIGQGEGDIEGWTDRHDLLLTPSPAYVLYGGHTRRPKLVGQPFVPGPNVKILTPCAGLDPSFLYYFLMWLPIESKGYADHFPLVRKSTVPLPPLPEQRRIVAILDEAFDGIAKTRANAKKNLENSVGLAESHIEATLSARTASWATRTLGEVCRVRTGKKNVNEGNPDGAFPFFTCAAKHTYSDAFSFDTEALLIAGNGNVGQVSYYSGKFEAYQRTYVLSDFMGVTARYLYRLLDKRLSRVVGKKKLGNTMPYIKLGMLTEFPVAVPPTPSHDEEMRSYLDEASEGFERLRDIQERKIAALDDLKKSLLHHAFTKKL